MLPLDAPVPDDVGALRRAGARCHRRGASRAWDADAPVLIEDFRVTCTHCAGFFEDELPHLIDTIEAGRVRFVLIPRVRSRRACCARRMCAGEQGRFWEVNDTLSIVARRFVSSFYPREHGRKRSSWIWTRYETCMDTMP